MDLQSFQIPGPLRGNSIPAYRWTPAGDATRVVVMVHGLGEHGRALPYQNLAGALTAANCLVISYDHRGHGESTGVARLPQLTDDLACIAGYAQESCGGLPVSAVGLSMGAMISMLACMAKPQLFHGVVAASAPLGPIGASRPAMLTAKILGNFLPGLSLDTGIDTSLVTNDGAALESYTGDPLVRTRTTVGLAYDLLRAAPGLRHVAQSLGSRALLLHGERDAVAPWYPELARELEDAGCSVQLFPDGHHNLFLDSGRGQVFESVIQWIENKGL